MTTGRVALLVSLLANVAMVVLYFGFGKPTAPTGSSIAPDVENFALFELKSSMDALRIALTDHENRLAKMESAIDNQSGPATRHPEDDRKAAMITYDQAPVNATEVSTVWTTDSLQLGAGRGLVRINVDSTKLDSVVKQKVVDLGLLVQQRAQWFQSYVEGELTASRARWFPDSLMANEYSKSLEPYSAIVRGSGGYYVLDVSGLHANPSYIDMGWREHDLKIEIELAAECALTIERPSLALDE